jgi:hypothetical protein
MCLSSLDLGSSPAHLRHSIRRIRRQVPHATLVAGLWGHEEDEGHERLRATAGADFYVSSLREALKVCLDVFSQDPAKLQATRNAKGESTAA